MPRNEYDDDELYDDDDSVDEEYDDEHLDVEEEGPRGRERVREEVAAREGGLKSRIGMRAVRPGEHDIIRSPVVLILGGSAVVLLLLAAIYGFMIIRESAKREFDAAQEQMDQGSFATAIQGFENFLATHPDDHPLVPSARILRGKCRIMQEINSATPDWTAGLEAIEEFRKTAQDLDGFDEQKQELRDYAERVARGAAEQALSQKRDNLLTVSPGLLVVSKTALGLVVRYSPADEKPEELQREVDDLIARTQSLIDRQQTFADAVKLITDQIKQQRPIDALETRRKLLERYDDFVNDPRLRTLMQQMLELEKSLIQVQELNRDAPPVPPRTDVPTLSLTLQTRARNDDVASGRLVIAVARNCCFGVDMNTGEPVWRQVIGVNSPFFPISVSASVPGLLLYNSRLGALTLLERQTGKVLWQQPIAEGITGAPIVEEGQIFLTTQASHLYKINLESGKITRRTRFSQPVLSPPLLMDGFLLVGGELSVVYTIDIRTLEPVQVSFVGQNPGTIVAPMMALGSLVVVPENREAEKCLLRVLRWNPDDRSLVMDARSLDPKIQPRVEGHVIDQPIVRGNQLFVPSTGQRITAFAVSDDPENLPLTHLADVQLEGQFDGPMYLDAGPDGQLWLASSALRKFDVKSQTINLDPNSAAEGLATQPLQRVGDQLYMARRMPYSDASFFSQIDRSSLTGYWRIILGASVLGTTSVEGGALIAVTNTGHIYRLNASDLEQGGFMVETSAVLRLPDNLATPLAAVPLAGNRLGVHCGGDTPQMWIISPQGQVEKTITLTAPLEAQPVSLASGVVAAVPGRLQIVGRASGGGRGEDYVAPVEPNRTVVWKSLAAVDDDQMVAVDTAQRLIRLQYRKTPVANLAEVAKMTLESPADTPLKVAGGRIFFVDGNSRLHVLDAISFETVASLTLTGRPTAGVWVAGDLVLVEVDGRKLQAFRLAADLQPAWTVDLEGGATAGEPLLVDGNFYIVQTDGRVQVVAAADGAVSSSLSLTQAFDQGAFSFGGQVLVPALDGTLHRIDAAGTGGSAE